MHVRETRINALHGNRHYHAVTVMVLSIMMQSGERAGLRRDSAKCSFREITRSAGTRETRRLIASLPFAKSFSLFIRSLDRGIDRESRYAAHGDVRER